MPAPVSVEAIALTLRQAGHYSVADELLTQEAAASTGGELVAAVSSRLLGLKLHYPHIYGVIQPQAELWLTEGRSGAVIIPTCPDGGYQ
ncbi:hypothetical protein [Hymenobacter terrestris]|uniref:Uncharacterized protein n=1 Tax=Hymenobacter terrestris TaxID=2748310 RepID=A0ABX2Q582_9BACT|nr:hypothetical protein [Hymenobacter terrestris]NVO86136.1 hypothetical protein [Hymenobacter terrestris]